MTCQIPTIVRWRILLSILCGCGAPPPPTIAVFHSEVEGQFMSAETVAGKQSATITEAERNQLIGQKVIAGTAIMCRAGLPGVYYLDRQDLRGLAHKGWAMWFRPVRLEPERYLTLETPWGKGHLLEERMTDPKMGTLCASMPRVKDGCELQLKLLERRFVSKATADVVCTIQSRGSELSLEGRNAVTLTFVTISFGPIVSIQEQRIRQFPNELLVTHKNLTTSATLRLELPANKGSYAVMAFFTPLGPREGTIFAPGEYAERSVYSDGTMFEVQ